MTYEEFLDFIPSKCMYETIYTDSDGHPILVIRLLDAYGMANKLESAEREACAEICKKHADFYAGLEPSPIAQSAWAACVDNRDTIRARGQA